MRSIRAVQCLLTLLLLSLCFVPARGLAQGAREQQVARLTDIEGVGRDAHVRTPIYHSNVPNSATRPREWGRVRIQYDTSPEWLDELVVQFYVLLGKRVDGGTQYSFLKTLVTYVDVAEGRDHLAEVYIRPQTLLRHGQIVAVGAEILVDGKIQDRTGDSSIREIEGAWWENPRLEARDGLLLNRARSPFAYLNMDRFETILQ